MAVTIDQIKSLRERTGVSMQACKRALEEADGNEEKAIELLRKRGEAKAVERQDRSAGQGTIAIAKAKGKAVMVKLLCETDFTARNEGFVALAQKIADGLLEGKTDFTQALLDMGTKVGEKIELGEPVTVEDAVIGDYVHTNRKIGVLVGMSGGSEEVLRDVAMHTAASMPVTIKPEEIKTAIIDKEKEIWNEELKKQGKPEAMFENIMKGKEKKFREERALLTQPFVKNPDQTIAQYLTEKAPGVEVHEVWRVTVG